MTGFFRNVKLDYLTIKPQGAAYLSLVLIVLILGFNGSSVTILCIAGAWFVALMSSNIFAIQEKNNLDRFYGSVSAGIKDIVLGRYVFVFLNYIVSFVAVIALSSTLALYQNMALELTSIMLGFSASFLVLSAITGIQMPLFFKMGYTKAKGWSIVPFVAVMALVASPSFIPALSGVVKFTQSYQAALIFGGILASCIIQYISYRIAIIAYRKQQGG